MALDYAENIVQLSVNLIALLMCLFRYISNKRNTWVYAIAFFLANLMSCYYWTVYMIVMRDSPDVSSLISDSGSNIAYLILFIFILKMRSEEERHFFHPLMLLPVPFCILQLFLYLPYGDAFLSLYQVCILTAVQVFCLQSICWYSKNRKADIQRPYIAITVLSLVICEFGMWLASGLGPPFEGAWAVFAFADGYGDVYYIFSFAQSLIYLCMVWAIDHTSDSVKNNAPDSLQNNAFGNSAPDRIDKKYQNILKISYTVVVSVCCVGGIVLSVWIRDTLKDGMVQDAESSVYTIIPVILFIISLFVVAFVVLIVFVISISAKIAENNELREARLLAEHANASKSRFLAQMSHEIRTPINTVLGMNEMILRESGDEAILDYAVSIQNAGRTLLALINSILDFSKIEEGKMEIIPVEYETSSFIHNLVASVSERAKNKGLVLIVDVDENLPSMLYGDDVRLSQVIMNILTNAVKYTDAGEVHLTMAAGAREKDHIELTVSVRDTGIGIREEDLPRLVKSFERLDEVRNRSVEGTGLGMAIATRLLDLMGSELKVTSVYGVGSTFSFTVIQQVRNDKPIGNYVFRLEASRDVGEETLLAEDARILVADDNEMNLKVASNLLKLFAITPDLAESGFEAIEFARQKSYHIILLDHMMPKMDGIETLARLKEERLLEGGTKVIALTANAVNGAREQYLSAGFDAYLSKPIVVSKLEEQLRNCLPPEICHVREKAGGHPSAMKVPAGQSVVGKSSEVDTLEALRFMGYDVDAGLVYVAGDSAFYLELVREFASKAEERIQAIRQAYKRKDICEYQILVHSLKNAARQIGANALAEKAEEQENASNGGDMESVDTGIDGLLMQYETVAGELNNLPGSAATDDVMPNADASVDIQAAKAGDILNEALKALDNYETECAAELLQPLKNASVDGSSLYEPIREILASLDEFDHDSAKEKINILLNSMQT